MSKHQKEVIPVIVPTLYDIDRAKDFLQLARDKTILGEFLDALKMLDQVQFHRDKARSTLLMGLTHKGELEE